MSRKVLILTIISIIAVTHFYLDANAKSWKDEVADLTERVERDRQLRYRELDRLVAKLNYINSNYAWFYMRSNQIKALVASAVSICEEASSLEDFKTCNRDLLQIYSRINSVRSSIYTTISSLEVYSLERSGNDLSQMKGDLKEMDKNFAAIQPKLLDLTDKTNQAYASAFASTWKSKSIHSTTRIAKCNSLAQESRTLASEARSRLIQSDMMKDAFLAKSGLDLINRADRSFKAYHETCTQTFNTDKLKIYIKKGLESARKANQINSLSKKIQSQCGQLNSEENEEISEICIRKQYNDYFIYSLHRATSPRPKNP